MFKYERQINYYETDQMAIVHHSNYFRYFEEARTAYMDEMGYPYKRFEEMNCQSPVVSISCKYKKPIKFGETIVIKVYITSATRVRCNFRYEICDKETDELRAVGESEHCFIDRDGKVVVTSKVHPEFYEKFISLIEE